MGDVTVLSDLMWGVANLIEAETHARFSFLSTSDKKYLDALNKLRNIRAEYMHKLEKEENSQLHCLNKHTLSGAFRLFEVGDKYLAEGKEGEASECYKDGDKLLEIFFNLNIEMPVQEKRGFIESMFSKKEVDNVSK